MTMTLLVAHVFVILLSESFIEAYNVEVTKNVAIKPFDSVTAGGEKTSAYFGINLQMIDKNK